MDHQRPPSPPSGAPVCRLLLAFIVILVMLLAAGCASPQEAPQEPTRVQTPPTTPASTQSPAVTVGDPARGEMAFLAYCAPCHGRDASGADYAPSLIHPSIRAKSDAELRTAILNGRGSMPAWRGVLTEEQLGDVLAFLRSRQR